MQCRNYYSQIIVLEMYLVDGNHVIRFKQLHREF